MILVNGSRKSVWVPPEPAYLKVWTLPVFVTQLTPIIPLKVSNPSQNKPALIVGETLRGLTKLPSLSSSLFLFFFLQSESEVEG